MNQYYIHVLHVTLQRAGDRWIVVERRLSRVRLTGKDEKDLSITSRSSNGAWLGAEDQKALAAMPRRNASQAILVTV